jgi:hypothetical protein
MTGPVPSQGKRCASSCISRVCAEVIDPEGHPPRSHHTTGGDITVWSTIFHTNMLASRLSANATTSRRVGAGIAAETMHWRPLGRDRHSCRTKVMIRQKCLIRADTPPRHFQVLSEIAAELCAAHRSAVLAFLLHLRKAIESARVSQRASRSRRPARHCANRRMCLHSFGGV